jgi:hypothetical protein
MGVHVSTRAGALDIANTHNSYCTQQSKASSSISPVSQSADAHNAPSLLFISSSRDRDTRAQAPARSRQPSLFWSNVRSRDAIAKLLANLQNE